MLNINDMEHFVLQPGETLILRCRTHMPVSHLEHARATLKAAGLGSVLILPPDFDIMAGQLEVVGAEPPKEELPSQEEIDQMRTQIKGAYEDGRVIEFREADNEFAQWCSAHMRANPHMFDFNRYVYRIPQRRQ